MLKLNVPINYKLIVLNLDGLAFFYGLGFEQGFIQLL